MEWIALFKGVLVILVIAGLMALSSDIHRCLHPHGPRRERKEIMEIVNLGWFMFGTVIGSLIGVVLMCCLQINRSEHQEIELGDSEPKGR